MRFLFNYPHNRLTGVNTHTYTMAKKLNELGHITDSYVDYLEFQKDILVSKLQLLGNVNIGNLPGTSPDINLPDVDSYDVVFLVYSWTAEKMAQFKKPLKVFIGHGLMEKMSMPSSFDLVDKMFYISSFGAEYLSQKYNRDISYMPSWIDINRFKPTGIINDKLKNILILDSRSAYKYRSMFDWVCQKRNVEVEVLSTHQEPSLLWNVEDKINKADLVVAYGRSAYEAMACDRNVLVYGVSGGDGMMMKDYIDRSASRNCSGWVIRNMPTPDKITQKDIELQLDLYDTTHIKYTRSCVDKLDVNNLESFLMQFDIL
jgi:glycosyltransferase involved in cell wall biosynthesis